MFEQRLTKNAKDILGVLAKITPAGSYLAGGTALALWIDHRNSYDLDIYSPTEFSLEEVAQKFKSSILSFQPISTSWQTLHGRSEDTEISLFYYQYPLLEKPTSCLNFNIASIEDIAAMKLEAVAGRGLKRDFFDLYKIIEKKNWSLEYLLELNDRKYKREGSFTPHLLRSLVYFDDGEKLPERSAEIDREWERVKLFFINKISAISKETLNTL